MNKLAEPKTNRPVAVVQFRAPDNRTFQHSIVEGGSLILGKDEQCGVRLDGSGISPRHCVIHVSDGSLFVTDWYSETGTRVNGEKIYAETCVRPHDSLDVGPWQLRFVMATEESEHRACFASPVPPAKVEEVVSADESKPAAALADEEVCKAPADANHAAPLRDDPLERLRHANEEIARLQRELDYRDTREALRDAHSDAADDCDEFSEVSLLRAEVERLQMELIEREGLSVQWTNGAASHSVRDGETGDNADSERLAERLDQLLGELRDADDRVRSLETLLQASDDAVLAEREEREQLGCWVSEIESRIAEREEQWAATRERLEEQLREATGRCQRAESSAEQVVRLHAGEFQQRLQQQISELQKQNGQLAQERDEARSSCRQLRESIARSGVSEEQLQAISERQAELKSHEIELAQERAQIARQTAEIARLRDELEGATAPAQNIENPDCRIRQFREHLREIHEMEEEQRRQRSLSNRISRLWSRLTD